MARKLAVTELAKMGYCETLLVMNKELNNADKGYRGEATIDRGNNEHDMFDERVKKNTNPFNQQQINVVLLPAVFMALRRRKQNACGNGAMTL